MTFRTDKLVETLGRWLSENGIDAKSIALKVNWQNQETSVVIDVCELDDSFTDLSEKLVEYVLVEKGKMQHYNMTEEEYACELKKARDEGAIFGFRLGMLASTKVRLPEGLKAIEADRIRNLPKSLIMQSIRFNERLEREEEWIQRSE